MPQCPLCGNQSNIHSFTYQDKTIYYPCTFCNAKLNALVNPKDFSEKENALIWADKLLEKTYNPPATDTLKTLCRLSKKSDIKPSGQNETSAPTGAYPQSSYPSYQGYTPQVNNSQGYQSYQAQDFFNNKAPSLHYTNIFKVFVITAFIVEILAGFIIGLVAGEFVGALLGALAGAASGALMYYIGMLVVEISTNIAKNTETNQRIEVLLMEKTEKKDK